MASIGGACSRLETMAHKKNGQNYVFYSSFLFFFNAGQRVANADGVALLHGEAHFAKPRSRKKRLYSSFVLSLEVLFTAVGSDVQEGKKGVP